MDSVELAGLPQISPTELEVRLADERPLKLEVREPQAWEFSNLSHRDAVLIPMDQVLERMGELDTAQEIVVQCRTGVCSAEIVHL